MTIDQGKQGGIVDDCSSPHLGHFGIHPTNGASCRALQDVATCINVCSGFSGSELCKIFATLRV